MNKIISIEDKTYPKLLKEIPDSPKQLYYKGDWDAEIFENCLAVVGSRRMTSYGKRVVDQLVYEVAAAGVTIVSGFMYGIDAAAHQAALNGKGRTIAVMPCGIDVIHPEHQEELYNDILEHDGLIISEFEGSMPPALWTYPKRNRIVAGLSRATLVVEAGSQSGSLITANYAKKFERKIFAVPGPITGEMSKGTLQLLQEGAVMVTSSKDILNELGFSSRFTLHHMVESSDALQKNHSSLGELERQILEMLQREPVEIDSLARVLGMPVAKLGTKLSVMQLSGCVVQEGGKYHAV